MVQQRTPRSSAGLRAGVVAFAATLSGLVLAAVATGMPTTPAAGTAISAVGSGSATLTADGPTPANCADAVGDRAGPFWHHPVAASIVDGFRPPSTAYGPGNRGLEYATSPGDEVTAAAAGRVSFAGPVGRSRFVVIEHPGGLRSTYAYLRTIDIDVGASVGRGQSIATADSGFHLTARRGATYVDPLLLMADGCFIVRLVPVPAAARRVPIDG